MVKLGDEYQALVGIVQKALDPEAIVNVGTWITGPDGKRDLDVEVRGTVDGISCFILIECKDWNDPVGIAVVDALESKRRDLNADKAIIYSNSGFTKPALRKASRVGICMASALNAGNKIIRFEIHKALIAKTLSVDRIKCELFSPSPDQLDLPNSWNLKELIYDNLPVQNWLSPITTIFLQENEPNGRWQLICTFRDSLKWEYAGKKLRIAAIRLWLDCSLSWVTQNVRQDVTLGLYDHIRNTVVIPANQVYMLGAIDQDAWSPYISELNESQPEQNSLEFYFILLNPLRPADDRGIPDLDNLVIERKFIFVDSQCT